MRRFLTLGAVLLGTVGVVWLVVGAGPPVWAEVTYGAVDIVAAAKGGRVVAASSEIRDRRGNIDSKWRKENLIDGLRVEGSLIPAGSYGWAADRPPALKDPAWVVFAFAEDKVRNVAAVRLDPRTADPPAIGRWVKNFTIETSVTTPQGPWQRVDTFQVINVAKPQEFVFGAPVAAKYLRLLITTNQGSNSSVELGEFEAFEALIATDEVTQAIAGLEAQLAKLRGYAAVHGGGQTLTNELPDYNASLIAAQNGGKVIGVSSEAADDAGKPLEQWRASNLVDGHVAQPDETTADTSFGWSSNAAPTEERPDWVIFQLPGQAGTVVDSVLVDSTARDPSGIGRGAKEIGIAVSTVGTDGPWTSVGRWQLPRDPKPQLFRFPAVEARYVRLMVFSNYGSNRYAELGEFGVYRLAASANALDEICYTIGNVIADLKLYREGALDQPKP